MIEKDYASFGEEFWKFTQKRLSDPYALREDDDEILEIAAKYGLASYVPYDPAIHGELNGDYEIGDEIWWWGE